MGTMKTVWKYDLSPNDGDSMRVHIEMPVGAQVLTAQMQHSKPQLWVLVDPNASKELRSFQVVGTGHPFEPAPTARYVNTFQMQGGLFVFHLFEVT